MVEKKIRVMGKICLPVIIREIKINKAFEDGKQSLYMMVIGKVLIVIELEGLK